MPQTETPLLPKTANTLKARQLRRLGDWLLENWPTIETGRVSIEDTAKEATVDLGFTVTAANLKTGAASIDRTWPKSTEASAAQGRRIFQRLAKQETAIRHLFSAVGILAATAPGGKGETGERARFHLKQAQEALDQGQ